MAEPKSQNVILAAKLNHMQALLEKWIEGDTGKRGWLTRMRRIDQIRLLTLETWSIRYHISVEEILDLLVPIFRQQIRKTSKKQPKPSAGLGVAVATLTSSKAMQILEERIRQVYPDDEHLSVWRAEEQQRQIRAEREERAGGIPLARPKVVSILEAESLSQYVEEYSARVLRERTENRLAHLERWRKRKNYRGSPWR